ncbi:hypothetical protein L195_g061035, partial [Trifolium pratense]
FMLFFFLFFEWLWVMDFAQDDKDGDDESGGYVVLMGDGDDYGGSVW